MYYTSAEYIEKVSNAVKHLKVHDHTCSIYDSRDEQFAVIIPFFKQGLLDGERCIYVADENSIEDVIELLGKDISDIYSYVESGALIVIGKKQAYFEKGYFSPEVMIEAIRRRVSEAKKQGYKAIRITAEMTWALTNDPGVERLLEYESEVNHVYDELDAVAICQYNKKRFSPEMIRHVLHTHPIIIYKGTVCRNFNYVPPEIYLKADDEYADVDRTLEQILEVERRENSLLKTLQDLERSNKDLEQFAYVASHDLQEPIRMVSAYTRLLEKQLKDILDEKTSQYMYYINDGAKRMHILIRDLLTFSRLTSKKDPFVLVDLNLVMAEIMRDLQVAISDHSAEIEFDYMPTVNADHTQMKQLFQNLIQNAIKFRGDAAPVIHIKFRKARNEYLFSIQDNGIGIAPEFFERIFVIFQRLHEREKYPGTGIGLSICKKIVERHGGKIWVESVPEHGTTFFFTLKSDEN